ncbi:MAG: hypothetical protein ABIN01_21655 [Ferruginibacter sp.]
MCVGNNEELNIDKLSNEVKLFGTIPGFYAASICQVSPPLFNRLLLLVVNADIEFPRQQ